MFALYRDQYTPLTIDSHASSAIIDTFSAGSGSREIFIEDHGQLTYLFIIIGSPHIDLVIRTKGKGASATVAGLILATAGSKITGKIQSFLTHDHTSSHIHLVSFLTDQGNAKLDGGVVLQSGIIQGVGHLLEENILLGEHVSIRTLPMLDVHSNDVQASHGATIQRLDEQKLFYLTSKGIPKDQAKRLMIEAYFTRLFSPFENFSQAEEIKTHYLDYLLSTL